MSTLHIGLANSFDTMVTVKEADVYSGLAFVSLTRSYIPENIRGINEMFMSPTELDQLGRFFVRQAEDIRLAQAARTAV
jgi:hypothetical protein